MRPLIMQGILLSAFFLTAIEGNAQEKTVLVVSSLPREADKAMTKSLVETAAADNVLKGYPFHSVCTLDEESTAEMKRELTAGSVAACVFLDLSSVTDFGPLAESKSVAILPSKTVLADGELSNLEDSVIATLPSGQAVADAFGSLGSPAQQLHVLHTDKSPGAEQFVQELQKALQQRKAAQSLNECRFPAGACRSEQDIEQALTNAFRDLKEQACIIVWPDINTLKFAYVIQQFARRHKLNVVAVGHFPGEGALLHVKRSNEEIAQECIGKIKAMLVAPASNPASAPSPQGQ